MTGLLALILAAAVILAYREVRRSAEQSASDRLDYLTHQLAGLSTPTTNAHAKLLQRVAASDPIRDAVRDPNSAPNAAVQTELASLIVPSAPNLPIELWTTDGVLVAALGAVDSTSTTGTSAVPDGITRYGTVAVRPGATPPVRFTPFYIRAGRIYYWTTVPVEVAGKWRGWLTQERTLTSAAGSSQQLNQLIGGGNTVYFRNADTPLWLTLDGLPATTPTPLPPNAGQGVRAGAPDTASYARNGVLVLANQIQIAGTPWAIVLEMPRSTVTAGARTMLRRFSIFGLVLLLIGAVTSWIISRRITRPLSDLTDAAALLARGDYSTRVLTSGSEEVMRLGDSFNRMAADVETAHTELERRFTEARTLARDLDSARAAAVSASRAKSNFLATISHEIRTPINAILGYTQLLELGLTGPTTDEQRTQLARIRSSTQHLLGLVNELLDLAKIESGAMRVQLESAPVAVAVDAATAIIAPQAEKHGLTISVRGDRSANVAYVGDEHRVRQILLNLLSNAVKFSEPGGEVVIEWSLVEAPAFTSLRAGEPCVALRVSDSGIGIGEEDLARLFQPFVQLEAANGNPYTRERSGAGLGLYISRQLAHLMGGDLTAESVVGHGSVFTVWLAASPLPRTTPRLTAGASVAKIGSTVS